MQSNWFEKLIIEPIHLWKSWFEWGRGNSFSWCHWRHCLGWWHWHLTARWRLKGWGGLWHLIGLHWRKRRFHGINRRLKCFLLHLVCSKRLRGLLLKAGKLSGFLLDRSRFTLLSIGKTHASTLLLEIKY